MFLPGLVLLAVPQDLKDTRGRTYAQILTMGRSRWHDFYVGKDGGVTAAESSAEGIYGDALAWRNDRLRKGAKSPLRKALQAFASDAVGVGSAVTGGGTIWNITGASLYADAEQAFYDVLIHAGKAPHRKVSDAERAVAKLRKEATWIEKDRSEDRRRGLAAMKDVDADLRAAVAFATRLPRRDSDTVLEFLRSTADAVASDGSPK